MSKSKKKICKNCCFINPYTDPHVLEPYTGGEIEWTCFLSGEVVELQQLATVRCDYNYGPNKLDAMDQNKSLEAFFQDL
jgi:hypothetical protein